MNTDIQPAKSLQERVGERIRDQIGDLLTDDDLKKLVETALHDAFFKERRESRQYGQDILHPPQIVEQVRKLLVDRVDAAVTVWLDEHRDEFTKHLDDAIGKGLSGLLQQWLDSKVQTELFQFGDRLKASLGIR